MTSVKALDTGLVERKFSAAKATQDSIQSVALWMLTHKAQCDQIVATWLEVLKTSKIERRLTLFYICNEIVQTCRKKHAIVYKDAFKEVLKDASILVKDKSISQNIERIFKIWEERGIYEQDFVQELLNLLNGDSIEVASSKLLSEFTPGDLRESVTKFIELENNNEKKRKKLTSVNVELTSKQIARLFKDRSQGVQYTQQIEDSHKNLIEFVSEAEKVLKERTSLINALECGFLFYDAQYGEARFVANAYRNFGNRIKNLQKKLEEQRKLLPPPISPIPSPTMDAPSPPESVCEGEESKDNMETVDMDMSDDESSSNGGPTTEMNTVGLTTTPSRYSSVAPLPLPPACINLTTPSFYRPSSNFSTPCRTPQNSFEFAISNSFSPPSTSSTLSASFLRTSAVNTFLAQFETPVRTKFTSANACLRPNLTSSSVHSLGHQQTTSMSASSSSVSSFPSVRPPLATTAASSHSSAHIFTNNFSNSLDKFSSFFNNASLSQESKASFQNSVPESANPLNSSLVESTSRQVLSTSMHSSADVQSTNSDLLTYSVPRPDFNELSSSKNSPGCVRSATPESPDLPFNSTLPNKAFDPFSLLNKLIKQNREAQNATNVNSNEFFDLITKSMKPVSKVDELEKESSPLPSGSSTPLLDDDKALTYDVCSTNEPSQANSYSIEEDSEMTDATILQTSVPEPLSPVTTSSSDISSDPSSLGTNILSKVSCLKPDVFEVLKSIINSTKNATDNQMNPQTDNLYEATNLSYTEPSDDHQSPLMNNSAHSDFLPDRDSVNMLSDSHHHYSDEDFFAPPLPDVENPDDDGTPENRNISPPALQLPRGPLVAPKFFLEQYSQHLGDNRVPADENDEHIEDMNHTIDETYNNSGLHVNIEHQNSFEYDDAQQYDKDPGASDYVAENFVEDYEEEMDHDVRYNDYGGDFHPPPPPPPNRFSPPCNFGGNYGRRNFRFRPRHGQFFERPPLFGEERFMRPRFYGRGRFPR